MTSFPDTELLLRDVQVSGRLVDVRIAAGKVLEGGRSPRAADHVIDGQGARLLPGLHDHHCHLLATAAAAGSVDCGAPAVRDRASLRGALRDAAQAGDWVRGVGYDDATAGLLDRQALDDLVPEVPVRVQHRSGSVWFVNSAAVAALGLDHHGPEGVERDKTGRATGRLWRMDEWLAAQDIDRPALDMASLGRRLASYGVTGVTDATPRLTDEQVALLEALPQRLVLMGAGQGPRKIVVSDHSLPGLDDLVHAVREARAEGRAVAVHSVTMESLWLTLAALEVVGVMPGDRIEHAAVASDDAVAAMARLGVTVCTQPSLVAARGQGYLARVDPRDRELLWRHRSFLAAGLTVLLGSDAPYGHLDPRVSLRAAEERRVVVSERVTPDVSLAGYLAEPLHPHRPRTVVAGAPADLVLLDAETVRLTIIGGSVAYDAT